MFIQKILQSIDLAVDLVILKHSLTFWRFLLISNAPFYFLFHWFGWFYWCFNMNRSRCIIVLSPQHVKRSPNTVTKGWMHCLFFLCSHSPSSSILIFLLYGFGIRCHLLSFTGLSISIWDFEIASKSDVCVCVKQFDLLPFQQIAR